MSRQVLLQLRRPIFCWSLAVAGFVGRQFWNAMCEPSIEAYPNLVFVFGGASGTPTVGMLMLRNLRNLVNATTKDQESRRTRVNDAALRSSFCRR